MDFSAPAGSSPAGGTATTACGNPPEPSAALQRMKRVGPSRRGCQLPPESTPDVFDAFSGPALSGHRARRPGLFRPGDAHELFTFRVLILPEIRCLSPGPLLPCRFGPGDKRQGPRLRRFDPSGNRSNRRGNFHPRRVEPTLLALPLWGSPFPGRERQLPAPLLLRASPYTPAAADIRAGTMEL